MVNQQTYSFRSIRSWGTVTVTLAVAFGFGLACSTSSQIAVAEDKLPGAQIQVGSSLSSTRLSLLGDSGRWNASTKKLKESMERVGVKSLVMPGDNLYSGTYDAAWGPWFKSGFDFPVVAIGNHNDGYQKEIQFFSMPGEIYAKTINGFLKFIVLNSDNRNNIDTQMDFLTKELAAATEPFVFVVYHHPTYTLTRDHTWPERREFHEAIRPVLAKHRQKITAVVLGHDHIASMGHFGDLPYILSGAGQNLRRGAPVDNVQVGVRVKSEWLKAEEEIWIELEASAQSPVVQLKAIRAEDDQVLCTAQMATGQQAGFAADCYAR
ncbi:MAG: metallophosphoesterase [Deltaproteobacteria bacterium]|jgi:predicted phosphodiesterase|nr:metallophosphoesterase [Deltaproteobacteria bacterium]